MSRLQWILVLATLLAVFVLAARLFGARTELEIQREQIEISWTKVEQALDRRAEVLPRLLEQIQQSDTGARSELADPSRHLAKSLALARRAPDRAERIEANRKVEHALQQLQGAVMADPRLRRDSDLQRLFEEILAVENRIHQDRTEYNEAVHRFNTRLALFPSNLAANVFGIRRHDFYVTTNLSPAAEPGPPGSGAATP